MRSLQILSSSAALLGGLASAVPTNNARDYNAPTDDGFPNPNQQQLSAIQETAGGQLPNGPPPSKLAPSTLTAFQLIAFNENFEVAFYSSLIDNITSEAPGYDNLDDQSMEEVLEVLETIKAQEELHSIAALSTLEHFGVFAPPPCTYKFPTSDIVGAFNLAKTFNALVLGTLQDASQLFATNGDSGPVRTVASIIGQEGEQNGWVRTLVGVRPSEKPFLTTSTAAFAYSALQGFVASCPFDVTQLGIPIFPALTVVTADIQPQDQTLQFTADLTTAPGGCAAYQGGDGAGLYVTYFTGQNLPVSEPVSAVSWNGNVITFSAFLPFEENVMAGFTLAALTTSNNFTNPDDVPNATLAAPGFIFGDMQL